MTPRLRAKEESVDEQRARILAASPSEPWQYDLALALGYEPESWDGMWKLARDVPFEFHRDHIIANELARGGTPLLTRLHRVRHDIPEGWHTFCNAGYQWQQITGAHQL